MNKRLLITALTTALGGVVVSAGAFAQQATANPDNQSASVVAQSNATTATAPLPANKKTAERAVPPLDSNMCIRDTGSHIKPPKGQCLPVNGNSYTQQDIQRTGAVTTGQALQMLDPSVQVNGGH